MKGISATLIVAIVIALVIGIIAWENWMYRGANESQSSPKSTSPLDVNLEFSSTPLLHKEVELAFNVKPWKDVPDKLLQNSQIKLQIPEGFRIISGNPFWQGVLNKDETKRIVLTVRAEKVGVWEIIGDASFYEEGSPVAGKSDIVFLKVSENGTETTRLRKVADSWFVSNKSPDETFVTVKNSGGSAMLIAECRDKNYITSNSDNIIEGVVEKVESRWNEEKTLIFTYSDLEITKYIKGDPFSDDKLQIITLGGKVGEIGLGVEDQPIFHEDKKVRIYFQKTNGESSIVCSQFGVEEIT